MPAKTMFELHYSTFETKFITAEYKFLMNAKSSIDERSPGLTCWANTASGEIAPKIHKEAQLWTWHPEKIEKRTKIGRFGNSVESSEDGGGGKVV